MTQLHQKLRDLRKASKWSQKEMAQELGISQSAYSQIENGLVSVSVEHLAKITDIFSISMDWLVKGKGLRPRLDADPCYIPLIKMSARAGYLRGTREVCEYSEDELMRLPDLPEGEHCAFEVPLESMEPTISSKDHLVCYRVQDVQSLEKDAVVLLIDEEGAMLGRLKEPVRTESLSLYFDNASFSEQVRQVNEIQELWVARGRVTKKLGKLESNYGKRLQRLEEEFETIASQLARMQESIT